MSKEIENLLRRARLFAPEARTAAWRGARREEFEAVAAAQGLVEASPGEADLVIVYEPDHPFAGPLEGQVMLVLAREARAPQGARLLTERPAVRYLPLREWAAGWPLPVAPAMAARLWETKWPGNREWVFARPEMRGPSALDTIKFLLVTFFGAGLSPIMPATIASACFVPPALLLLAWAGSPVFRWTALALAILASLASLWLEKWAERRFLAADPRQFVLDEVAGLSLAWVLLPEPAAWWGVVAGFAAFRVFDIFKWGVKWVERLPGRGGVLWDDLLAGLYAGIVVRVLASVL